MLKKHFKMLCTMALLSLFLQQSTIASTKYPKAFDNIFEKLDNSKIPKAQKINEKAKYTVENGYGPAYTLNSIGIVVDPTSNIEINSWEDLWKPELKGKIAIPDITTTNGAAVVDIAATKAGVDITEDNGEAAFKELEKL